MSSVSQPRRRKMKLLCLRINTGARKTKVLSNALREIEAVILILRSGKKSAIEESIEASFVLPYFGQQNTKIYEEASQVRKVQWKGRSRRAHTARRRSTELLHC